MKNKRKNGRPKNMTSGFMRVSKSPLLKHVEYQMNCEENSILALKSLVYL